MSTAVQAYLQLEDEGVVVSRPRSGHFVGKAAAVATPVQEPRSQGPVEVSVAGLFMELLDDANRPGVINLGTALPGAGYLPLRRLARIAGRLARGDPDLGGRYGEVGGAVTNPAGGYLLWVALPEGIDGVAVYRAALARGVRVIPGRLFSPSDVYARYLRVSCAQTDPVTAKKAVAALGEAVREAAGTELGERAGIPE